MLLAIITKPTDTRHLGQNKWTIWVPPLPPYAISMMKKKAFWFERELIIDMGGGGFCFSIYFLSKIVWGPYWRYQTLYGDKIDWIP